MFRVFLSSIIWLSFLVTYSYSQECEITPASQNAVQTPSKTSFHEIAQDIIDRLEKYQVVNKRYASAQENIRFENIGLDPAVWEGKNFSGIVYTPKGNTFEVYPAEGYTFFIDDFDGNTSILSWDIKWPLIYNLVDKKWYFYEISPEEVVNINTLQVKKDTPYNPQEYK